MQSCLAVALVGSVAGMRDCTIPLECEEECTIHLGEWEVRKEWGAYGFRRWQ